ncbi:MAG: heme biosynthesis protein HemY, partial [Rhizobiales bacterium]|nr:heme biosynthesis protein HemY [Hyphomicrobiales bacterium]
AAVALSALSVVLALLGEAVRSIVKAPDMLGRFLGTRRRERGYRALSTGLVAVGAGDARTARRAADESTALLGEAPMTLLLTAQAAQLAGDADRARKTFEALAARDDTRVLGLHGLFVEARRDNNHEAARHFAEEAVRAVPAAGWAGTALFEYQARAGDWLGALRTLAANADAKVLDKARAKRLRAELLTARAMELEAGDPTEARALAQEAHRLAPELVPAATVAARLLTRADEIRRAVKVLETTWKAAAHPEIADAYAVVRPGDSFRDRLKRMRRLADMRTGDPEGAMAIARVAIDGRDWSAARAALAPLAAGTPSERACLLMAEIEEREGGDQGRVRHWLTRALTAPRDPA